MRLISTSHSQQPADPTGGMTLDALMARQKELARSAPVAPAQIASPWQGAALMANTFVNSLQQRQAQEQEKAGRAALAQIIGGIDPNTGATSQQVGALSALDPDMATRMMADAMSARREAARQAHDDVMTREGWNRQDANTRAGWEHADQSQQAGFEHADQSQAATFAQQDKTRAEAAKLPQSPVGQIQADFDNGVYGDPTSAQAQQLRDDAIKKATTVAAAPGAASDRKALWGQQDDYINTAQTLTQLGRASELLHQGINTGYTSGVSTFAGATGLTGKEAQETASRTKEYNSIMNQEAILAMSNILKGATSNTEMAEFIKNMNDPTLDATVKAGMIDRMVAKAQSYQELQAARIKELGGDVPQQQQAPAPLDEAKELQDARDAIAKGAPAEMVRKRMVDKGIDPGKL